MYMTTHMTTENHIPCAMQEMKEAHVFEYRQALAGFVETIVASGPMPV